MFVFDTFLTFKFLSIIKFKKLLSLKIIKYLGVFGNINWEVLPSAKLGKPCLPQN